MVNYWAHLGEGEQAYDSMNVLFRQSTFPNLMDTHPPGVFQIDGNLGGANGMLETLVQSRWFPDHAEVDLLPALPSAWKSGQVSGIRVRGGAEIAMKWDGGALRSAHWQASQDMPFQIHVPAAHQLTRLTANGETQSLPTAAGGKFRLNARKGVTYELGFEQ